MLRCKDIVKIVSVEEPRDWRRRLELRLHMMMCRHCRNYARQIEMLSNGVKAHFRSESNDADKIKEMEDRIVDQLKK
jgi:hypothetical protein